MESGYYMLSFSTSGVKNIKDDVRLDFYKRTVDKHFDPEKYRIKAIYGENGSGKTSLVTSVDIFKSLLTNGAFLTDPLNQKMLKGLLNKESDSLRFACEFLHRTNNSQIMYSYLVELQQDEFGSFEIAKESFKYKSATYNSSKYTSIYNCNHGNLSAPMLSPEAEDKAVQASVNLLNTKTFAYHSAFAKNRVFAKDHDSSDTHMHIINLLLFAYQIQVSIESSDRSDLYVHLQSLRDSDVSGKSAFDAFDRIVSSTANSIGISTKYVTKDEYDAYMENVRKMERFLKLFRNDLQSIDIERKENGEIYECYMLMNYGTYRVDTAFESTGINKLIRYFSYLSAASRGDTVFIDEMDSNINDVYLCKLVEFFMKYGKGQLCFTTHNTSPMTLLKKNKNSIDFLTNDNRIIPWRTNGNFAPDKLYKNGMIEYLPFNIEAEDFVGILGE